MFDSDGNYLFYELLDGEYPKEWAAASDMLEALEEIADSATSINGPFTQYNVDDIQSPPMALARTIARAVIAKARGEAS